MLTGQNAGTIYSRPREPQAPTVLYFSAAHLSKVRIKVRSKLELRQRVCAHLLTYPPIFIKV